MKITEIHKTDGSNTLFKTNMKYSEGTLKGFKVLISDNSIREEVELILIGEQYFQTKEVLSTLYDLFLEYDLYGSSSTENPQQDSIETRIKSLERTVENLYTITKGNKEAINNRVNITAFRAWLKLVEKKTGIKLTESDLSIIDRELMKD